MPQAGVAISNAWGMDDCHFPEGHPDRWQRIECYGHEQQTNPPNPHEYRCSTGANLNGNKQSQDSLKLPSNQSDCYFQALLYLMSRPCHGYRTSERHCWEDSLSWIVYLSCVSAVRASLCMMWSEVDLEGKLVTACQAKQLSYQPKL